MQYAGVALATLGVRLAVVAVLDRLVANSGDGAIALAILICGAGVSFFVNFALSRWIVFAREAA